MGSEAIIVFLIAGIVLVAGANFLSGLISHKSDNPQKREPYESGMVTIGPTWVQFKVGYYLFAISFRNGQLVHYKILDFYVRNSIFLRS